MYPPIPAGLSREKHVARLSPKSPQTPLALAIQLSVQSCFCQTRRVTSMRERVRSMLEGTREASPGKLSADPGHALWSQFHQLVRDPAPQVAVEVGSRARSGNLYRDWLPDTCRYVGFDIHAGPNVDVVGDAHRLSAHIDHGCVDVAWSISTFEHLAMPWVAAVELG